MTMEVASSGGSNGVAPATPTPFVDSSTVVQYLVDVLQVTLGALKTELEGPGSLLSKAKYSETVQRCTRFASESQVALYVQKDIVGTEEGTQDDDAEGISTFYFFIFFLFFNSFREVRNG